MKKYIQDPKTDLQFTGILLSIFILLPFVA